MRSALRTKTDVTNRRV